MMFDLADCDVTPQRPHACGKMHKTVLHRPSGLQLDYLLDGIDDEKAESIAMASFRLRIEAA